MAMQEAVEKYGKPDIIKSDQSSQFISNIWLKAIDEHHKGRCNDNANIERLWRSCKYDRRRPHHAFCYQTLAEVHDCG